MALRVRRSSAPGRPVRLRGGRSGCRIAHWASVRSLMREMLPDQGFVTVCSITVTDYAAAAVMDTGFTYDVRYKPFVGFNTDVYVCRLSGGPEMKLSASGAAHHPSWERDIPVKSVPRATAT